jgi:CO/xanthine dehydrogenase FAD-binding subunit
MTAWVPCRTVAEACAALARHGADARLVAGGTDLMIELRRPGAAPPSALVDLSRVPDLGGIASTDGSVRVGALATHAQAAASPLLRLHAPLLAEACASVGSPQIRNRGTLGGNVMNAATCADAVPPLVALGAVAILQAAAGERTVALADLSERPYVTRARPDEVLTGLAFAPLPAVARSAFLKLGRRNALAIARLSVAAVLACDDDGVIRDARIVPGAALPVWRRVTEAERMLVGERPSHALFEAAGAEVARVMVAATGRRWSTEYKEPVIAVLVRRALARCAPPVPAEVAR